MIALALAAQLAVLPLPAPADASPPESKTGEVRLQAKSITLEGTLPAAMSLVVPGSGQFLQGRVERGLLHLGAAATLGLVMLNAESLQANTSGPAGSGQAVRVMSAAALLGLAVWSPLDAWWFEATPAYHDPSVGR
ncbi:hypothetical protein D3C86_423950 [compost metagenome]